MRRNLIPVPGDPMFNLAYRTVEAYIRKHQRIPLEMKRALKDSPHVRTLMKNLAFQFRNAQDLQIKRRGKRFKEKTIINGMEDVIELFIKGVEGHATRRQESEIAAYQREHADDETKEMQSTLEGNSTGVFEDMGLIIPIDQQEQTENHIKEPVKHDTMVDYGAGRRAKEGASD